MATGNWFRKHRRQGAIHSCVIVGFLVFTLFAAEPLFDRLERIPGEAGLHRIALPAETSIIRSHVRITTDDRTAFDVMGWAFIDGENSENCESYIVLRSDRRTYVFDTVPVLRTDVTAHFEELGLNLDYSGFIALIPTRRVASGEYTVGIYIRKGETEALQYTGRTVVVGPGG